MEPEAQRSLEATEAAAAAFEFLRDVLDGCRVCPPAWKRETGGEYDGYAELSLRWYQIDDTYYTSGAVFLSGTTWVEAAYKPQDRGVAFLFDDGRSPRGPVHVVGHSSGRWEVRMAPRPVTATKDEVRALVLGVAPPALPSDEAGAASAAEVTAAVTAAIAAALPLPLSQEIVPELVPPSAYEALFGGQKERDGVPERRPGAPT